MPLNLPTILVEEPCTHVVVVRLNRPHRANALDTQMGRDLLTAWAHIAAGVASGDVRVVVLAAAGDGAFCGGADLTERDGMSDEAWAAQHAIFEEAIRAQLAIPVPVLAAVSGHAYAGGLELALACDFAYGVPHARFAMTEVTIGILPGLGGTQLLPRVVGERRAKELICTGASFTADEAVAWGVLNRVCPPDALWDTTLATAAVVAGNAPLSVRAAKRVIHEGLQGDLARGLDVELEAYRTLVGTDDRREGVRSFADKRRPLFQGR